MANTVFPCGDHIISGKSLNQNHRILISRIIIILISNPFLSCINLISLGFQMNSTFTFKVNSVAITALKQIRSVLRRQCDRSPIFAIIPFPCPPEATISPSIIFVLK